MAALTATIPVSTGVAPATPAQITAWSGTGDTLSESVIGDRGVVCIVTNSSGGSLDFRVSDPGRTPAGNAAANGYTTVTVANGATRWVYVGRGNVDPATGVAKIGASTSNAAFTVLVLQY
jgi:hypothetical protein